MPRSRRKRIPKKFADRLAAIPPGEVRYWWFDFFLRRADEEYIHWFVQREQSAAAKRHMASLDEVSQTIGLIHPQDQLRILERLDALAPRAVAMFTEMLGEMLERPDDFSEADKLAAFELGARHFAWHPSPELLAKLEDA